MVMFFIPIGSHLTQKNWNPRLLISIGAIVAFPCFIISAFVDKFYAFAILYIIAFSFNQGMAYMVNVHHGWLWFPKNPGLVSGIILGGFGAGALIFDNVLTHVVNPDNVSIDKDGYYPKEVNDRFRKMWLLLIGCWFVITIIGILMTFSGPVK